MALIGTAIAGGLGAFGDKPKVPKWSDISLAEEQRKSIAANTAALPEIENLASRTNAFNQEQIQKMLRASIPNYDSIVSGVSGNIDSFLKGEIPKDVADQIQTNSASRSLSGGFSGTGMSHNLNARDLGLTSLSLTERGVDSASRWLSSMGSLSAPGAFNAASLFITPQQQFSATFQNQDASFNAGWLKNQVKAMPDPFMKALGAAFINDESSITSALGSVAGASGGGGGGM